MYIIPKRERGRKRERERENLTKKLLQKITINKTKN